MTVFSYKAPFISFNFRASEKRFRETQSPTSVYSEVKKEGKLIFFAKVIVSGGGGGGRGRRGVIGDSFECSKFSLLLII